MNIKMFFGKYILLGIFGLMLLSGSSAFAQDAFPINVNVTFVEGTENASGILVPKTDGKTVKKNFTYGIMISDEEYNNAMSELRAALKEDINFDDKIKAIKKKYVIGQSNKTRVKTDKFSIDSVCDGFYVVIITSDNSAVDSFKITKGQRQYDRTIIVHPTLPEIVVGGKYKVE